MDRKKLKKMTLEEFKQKFPKLVENIRSQERAKLHGQIEEKKRRIKEIQGQIKQKKEQVERRKEGLQEEYNTLLAKKAKLVLNQQKWEQADLVKKKLKNMPSSLKAILTPVLSSLSSSEDMDSEISEAVKVYQATHPSEPIGGVMERREPPGEEEKQAIIDREIDEAFS